MLLNPYMFQVAVSTSYANTGGSGDRTSSIPTISQVDLNSPVMSTANLPYLIDGVNGNVNYLPTGVADGKWVKFDFGSAKVINEAKWYQNTPESHGTWKFEGSNDDSSYTDVGSSFTLGGSTAQTITAISGNTTAYRYYKLTKVSGSNSSVPYVQEIEFKISA